MAQHFSLGACDVVGFDLDHTLCRYNLPESARLIYNSFAQFLVKEKGYDEGLLTLTPEDWDFCCKGLALDLEDGTFIKLAADGTVLRASHGTKMMTPEALTEAFGKKEWRHCVSDKRCTSDKPGVSDIPCCSGKCYFYDNYFDLPGALLCARVVDSLTKQNRGQKTFDFWKDVVAGIQHNFKMSAFKENCGFFFPEIKRNLGKYVHRCPESVRKWLRQLKDAGKITMLITSSHSDYCKLLGSYILGEDFADLFDIVITNALKPGFFSHFPSQRPFYTLENDEEKDELPSLDKPGWYSQGNAAHLYELLKKMTSKPEPKVVYFGDSMHSDIFPAHHYTNWETVLILEELQGPEMEKPEEAEPLEKRGKYENQLEMVLYACSPSMVNGRRGSEFQGQVLHQSGLYVILSQISKVFWSAGISSCFYSLCPDHYYLMTSTKADNSSQPRFKSLAPMVKPLNTLSNKWGSYFIDSVSGRGRAEDSVVYTWSSKRISTYSTIAIPNIESIAELPLDYKFTRFSTNNSKMAGYYPLVHHTLGSQDTDSKIISTEK